MPEICLTRAVVLLCLMAAGLTVTSAEAQPLNLRLPTSNDALYRDDGPDFYQYTDRYFRGVRSRPWQGGQYGFVRNEKETPAGVVFTRFHEGVDIKPVYRDRDGEPLDTVRAVDAGLVVYVNTVPGRSSYGKYVVVEHWWSGAPFYSLYAHLGDVRVQPGQQVRRGDRLGRMGYTGRGINRRRAHLHFEINMLLNERFQAWYDVHYRKGTNRHDLFNGLNLAGIDVAALYLALRDDPTLTIEDFFRRHTGFFSVVVPNTGLLDLHNRYPWLGDAYDPLAPALDIEFTQSGAPLRIRPVDWQLSEPTVSMAQPSEAAYDHITYYLSGLEGSVALSRRGRQYLELLTHAPHDVHLPTARVERDPDVHPTAPPPETVREALLEEEPPPVRGVRGW